MATIRIHREHQQTLSALRGTAEAIARRIEARHAVRWQWEGDSMELTAAIGARGRVTIGAGDVAIEIHLPLALSPARGMVERRVAAKLDAILGG